MANIKITDLPSASAVTTSVVPVSNAAGTATNKVTLQSIAALTAPGFYATTSAFPATGEETRIYCATDVGRIYRWDGSVYAEVGSVGGGGSGVDTELRAYLTPAAPTNVAGTAGNAQVALTWTAPSSVAPITDYVVQYSSNSGSTWTTFSDGTSTAASATVTGLTNGTAYTFRVAAVSGIGQGAWSATSASVTPSAGVSVSYLVVAGGGGGGNANPGNGGGGGAGGYRTNRTGESSGGGAAAESAWNAVPGVAYTVTVGGGGEIGRAHV